jgi:hypothetical protein
VFAVLQHDRLDGSVKFALGEDVTRDLLLLGIDILNVFGPWPEKSCFAVFRIGVKVTPAKALR